jgi:argininosuccinate lyase
VVVVRGERASLEMWDVIATGAAAHVVMLRDTAIIDDAIAASVLTAIDGVRRGEPPVDAASLSLVAAFEERVDSLVAPGAVAAVRIARARHDLAAAAQRLVLRDSVLALAAVLDAARAALLGLAEDHVFTLMQVYAGGSPLQPTNLAHFLTGTIAPLARAARRLHAVYDELDRSPLGAAALAGPGFPVDRDETADLLGSEGPVPSTFDALAAVDHVVDAGHLAAGVVLPMRRLIEELLRWLRADPQALRLADALTGTADPTLPFFHPPAALERLVTNARLVEADADAAAHLARETAYGPAAEAIDAAVASASRALAGAVAVAETFATLLSGPVEINRAWLARQAGRALVTSGDLADLLMAEEGLEPAAARDIAALTASRAEQEGIEASGITPALIDAAALLVIGREVGIEIERLGAYLAPRRFVEKRTLLGGPAPAAVREILALERVRLDADRRWLEEKRRRIALAAENLEIRTQEVLAAASSG